MIENVDYKILYEESDDKFNTVSPIEILTGKYKGVKYKYGKCGLKVKDDEKAKLSFQYVIVDKNKHSSDKLKENEFVELIGNILNDMLVKEYDENGMKITMQGVEK